MIYDCFRFHNEMDLLEIRLNELRDVADRHVIVESSGTFTGGSKPYYLDEWLAKDIFAPFLGKITRVKISNEHGTNAVLNDWGQADAILQGLHEARDDDWIIVGDCDEIPRASTIESLKELSGPMQLVMPMYYYYANVKMIDRWDYAKLAPKRDVVRLLPRHLRCLRDLPALEHAGWHFCWLGGIEQMRLKLKSTAHTEYNVPEFSDPEKMSARVQALTDLFDREMPLTPVPLDDSFPSHLIHNKSRFNHLIHYF